MVVGFRGTYAAKNWDIDYDVKQIPAADYLHRGQLALINNQNGSASEFEMCFFGYRIPAPLLSVSQPEHAYSD